MLPGLLPTLPTSLLPSSGGADGNASGTFAAVLGGGGPSKDQAEPPMLREFASRYGVNDPQAPLHRAGLPRDVSSGEFMVHVRRAAGLNSAQFVNEAHTVRIYDTPDAGGTSLQDVAASLNGIAGIKASVADDGRLVVTTTDQTLQFRFGDDTSNLLNALGSDKTPLHQAFDKFVGTSLYGQMLASMRKTQGKPKYLYGGRTEEVFQQQLDQQLVQNLTAAQGGALADAMYEQQFNAMRR